MHPFLMTSKGRNINLVKHITSRKKYHHKDILKLQVLNIPNLLQYREIKIKISMKTILV